MNTEQLEDLLSRPTPADIAATQTLAGNILILGAGGKMGPTLAQRVRRAAGPNQRVLAVSRSGHFAAGIEQIPADLLDANAVAQLPDAAHILYLVGRKFGSSGNEPLTWATNAIVPTLIASRYPKANIVVLSTGNVYPFTSTTTDGPTEQTPTEPIGEYAQSALARERIFEYFSQTNGTPVTILRLNYAVEPRYGVLVDIATKVLNRTPIDLTMGHLNFIWQGDANSVCLRALTCCTSPARILNLTGTEIHSVRELAGRIGAKLGIAPVFTGHEAHTALLSNAAECAKLFGAPPTSVDEILDLTLEWLTTGGHTLGKPTHFETRTGRY